MTWQGIKERVRSDSKTRVAIKNQAWGRMKHDLVGNLQLMIMPLILMAGGSFLLAGIIGGFLHVRSYAALVGVVLLFLVGIFVIFMFGSYGIQVMNYQALVQIRDEEAKAHPWQSFFKTYLRNGWLKRIWVVYFFTALFLFLWNLIPALANYIGTVINAYTMMAMISGGDSSAILAWSLLFKLLAIVMWIFIYTKALGYSFGQFVMFEAHEREREIGGRTLLKNGLQLVKGHRWELTTLLLSYFWWYVLVIVVWGGLNLVNRYAATIGVGLCLLVIGPYFALVAAGYYEKLRAEQSAE